MCLPSPSDYPPEPMTAYERAVIRWLARIVIGLFLLALYVISRCM